MNKEVITVGDVYRVNEWLAVVISIDPNFDVNGKMNILFSDFACHSVSPTIIFTIPFKSVSCKSALPLANGDISTSDESFFLKKFRKVGHIEKFAEALKELQEMAENI